MSLKNRLHNQQAKGSITVFLSLILMLIFSLLLTIIEGARVGTAKVYAERALSTAMDSVFAEYYGPLWEEYHIFGYYPGGGTEEERCKQISESVKNYMSYTFEPDKDLNLADSTESYELFNTELNSISVNNETMLMDYQGELLINEAVEYMKYSEMGNGMELLMDKLSLLQTPEKVSYIYEEKQKVEEELVEIDKGILKLMKLLDGLQTDKKGIEVTKKGELKTVDYFVKKICFGEVTKETVGINQDNIFQALKNSYVNPSIDFEILDADFTGLETVLKQIEEIQAEQVEAEAKLLQEQMKLDTLNALGKKTKDDKQQIKEIKKTINALQTEIKTSKDKAEEQEKVKQQLVKEMN